MKNLSMKQQIKNYATEIIKNWMSKNPYANSDHDEKLTEFVCDELTAIFGNHSYYETLINDSIDSVLCDAEDFQQMIKDDQNTITCWIKQIYDEAVMVDEDDIKDPNSCLEYLVDSAVDFLPDFDGTIDENFIISVCKDLVNKAFNKKNNLPDVDTMIADLEEYYECAGLAGYYDRVLVKLSDDQVIEHWKDTFKDFPDYALCF